MSEVQTSKRRALNRYMHWDASLPPEIVDGMWRDPAALLAGGLRLQHKPSCTVVRLDAAAAPLMLKHHVGGGLRKLRRALSTPSAARKAWIDGCFLHHAGVPTPRPRAVLEQRLGPLKTSSYFLADFVPGRSLYRLLRFERPQPNLIRDLARQTAAIWQRLHDLAVCHNDFKTENLLVDPQGKVWLIDVDRMLRFRRRDPMRLRQARDAANLLHERNWRSDPTAAEIFRQEILQTAAGRETAKSCPSGHALNRPSPTVNPPSHLVTALVPCRNSANSIRSCLQSLRDVADEILVADAGSTDGTLRAVREFGGCRIIHGRAADDAAFLAWAARQAAHPWVLLVLPEEQLNPELGRQVQDATAGDPDEDGFRIWRALYIHGRRLKHGGFQHDFSIRLFRKDAVRFEMRGARAEVTMPGKSVGQLASRLICELWHNADVRQASFAGNAASWGSAWQFFKTYVLQLGLLDGRAGFAAASLSAKNAPQRGDYERPSAIAISPQAPRRGTVVPKTPSETRQRRRAA
jgi:hypothetical protein